MAGCDVFGKRREGEECWALWSEKKKKKKKKGLLPKRTESAVEEEERSLNTNKGGERYRFWKETPPDVIIKKKEAIGILLCVGTKKKEDAGSANRTEKEKARVL